MKATKIPIPLLLLFLACFSQIVGAASLTTAITYQGRLTEKGLPANGKYDLQFGLFDSPSLGEQLGPTVLVKEQPVADGFFVVKLDFGSVFEGKALWLDIAVRPAGDDGLPFNQLTPRQELTPVPFAMYAIWSEGGGSGITGSGTTGRLAKFTGATRVGNSVVYESSGRIGIGTTTPTETLTVGGNGLVTGNLTVQGAFSADTFTGSIDISQIVGLLGQGFTLQFPDVVDNSAPMEMDGIVTTGPIVILSGPGYDIERIPGFLWDGTPNDQPGFAMEHPFIFEASGSHATNLIAYFNTYLANPTGTTVRAMSIIILALDRMEVFRWNLSNFAPADYEPGVDGRTRFRMLQRNPPDTLLGYQMSPADSFGTSSSCNPATDKLVEIDGIVGICPQVEVNETNRTLTFTYDFVEGRGIFDWVSRIIRGVLDLRSLSVIERNELGEEIGRRNYSHCFPIKYEQFTGYGLSTKVKARVRLSFDFARDG